MKQLGSLKHGQYPSLRVSLSVASRCQCPLLRLQLREAASNSILENLYGPTELTSACTFYRWDPVRSPDEVELGIVPIGYPYPGMSVFVADQGS